MLPREELPISSEFQQHFRIAVVDSPDDGVEAIVCDESDLSALDYIRSALRKPLVVRYASTESVAKSIGTQSGARGNVETQHRSVADDLASESKTVREIASVVTEAVTERASDIHFEPGEDALACRTRVDGVLQQARTFPKSSANELLARIKILSGLDIAEKRRPQDGRIRFPVDGRTVDIRVSVVPTALGEKAVLRLLDKQQLRLTLDELGYSSNQLSLFKRKIASPNGIVLVTGPTGSGKTTTLYAALQGLNRPGVNISTVEDPIEYEISGVNQSQVKLDIDVTFASMLRALLRQDPNIIMIGEIRDQETLEIAIRASLTGHLVLSTVHTNSAVATPSRLIDMGAKPYLLSSTLRLIVAQRLLRRVCVECADLGLPSEELAAAQVLGITLEQGARVGTGCSHCRGSGYKGRLAIAELLDVTDELRESIERRVAEHEMLQFAQGQGFTTMVAAAEKLINEGLTTPSEALRELQQ